GEFRPAHPPRPLRECIPQRCIPCSPDARGPLQHAGPRRWDRARGRDMSIPRDRFAEGMTWDDWVEMQGTRGPEWQIRYDEAALGELRADFQDVPTPRFVFCIFDPANADSEATVPLVVKACDQAGVAGGVDVRLFPADLHPDLVDQFRTDDEITPTTCVVFDQ